MATLAPELTALPHPHRLIWADAEARHQALEAIVSAWERDSPDLGAHIARVDDAVTAALSALGLPRGPVAGVEVVTANRFWTGRKHPDCHLQFDGPTMRQIVRVERNDDDLLRTWTHESLHARLPFDPHALIEAAGHRGYEEGLAEGLARCIVAGAAGLRPLDRSYAYFVAQYEALADALRIDVEGLWRRLWRFPAGQVRAAFIDQLASAVQAAGGPALTNARRLGVAALADQVFSSPRRDYPVDRDAMLALWRMVLR